MPLQLSNGGPFKSYTLIFANKTSWLILCWLSDAEQNSLNKEDRSTMSDIQTNNLNIGLPDLQSDPSKPLNIEQSVTRTRIPSQNKAEENCKKYLDTILDVVGKDDGRKKSTNIVLIGPPGMVNWVIHWIYWWVIMIYHGWSLLTSLFQYHNLYLLKVYQ